MAMMTLKLSLPEAQRLVRRKFLLPSTISRDFDLYVEAARVERPDADENMVLETILETWFRKDRGFRGWLRKRK